MIQIRRLVSKKKKRFQADGFDLDLTYVTDRIVAMGFPSVQLEGLYRNKMSDVKKFFDTRHNGKYKVYNLCSERAYEPAYFDGRVERYPFDDHNAPPFEIILPFCRSVDEWMKQDKGNIAVVHCKAGKGRTGVMICAYLVYIGVQKDAIASMDFYASQRTKDKKGVTIPSQKRYIVYFDRFMKNKAQLPHPGQTLYLDKIVFNFPPKSFGPLEYKIRDRHGKELLSNKSELVKSKDKAEIICKDRIPLMDDLKMSFKGEKKALSLGSDKDLFHIWINISFIDDNFVRLTKPEIDRAHKDKKHKTYHKDFSIDLVFTPAPSSGTTVAPEYNAASSSVALEEPPSPISSRDSDEFTDPENQEGILQELEEEIQLATKAMGSLKP